MSTGPSALRATVRTGASTLSKKVHVVRCEIAGLLPFAVVGEERAEILRPRSGACGRGVVRSDAGAEVAEGLPVRVEVGARHHRTMTGNSNAKRRRPHVVEGALPL